MIEIRLFRPDDFHILLELANQAVPFAPKENAEWFEQRKAFDESKRLRRHYIATDKNNPVGYGCLEQQGEGLESLRIYVVCSPENLRSETGAALFARLKQEAQALGATTLWARELQADEPARQFFTQHGFIETQRLTPPNYLPLVVFQLLLAH
jgi:N-acetylglutamate synthase-like GNAT family acetyltransferase